MLAIWSCGGAPAVARDAGADAASESEELASIELHAVVDLPRQELTRTLSAITTDGIVFYALPDRAPRLTVLTPAADLRAFTVSAGISLQNAGSSTWDGEGLAWARDGSFYAVTVETAPTLVHFAADGARLEEISLPARFAKQASGNKGLESLSLAPSGRYLFTCNETALPVDGKPPTKQRGAVVRILRLDLERGGSAEFAYRTEPLGAGSGGDMGVSDVLALTDDQLLILERGYQSDYGNTIRIFSVDLSEQTDVSAVDSLGEDAAVVPKQLLIDLDTLPPGEVTHPGTQHNPLLDNYEGLTLGPLLPDGRQALVLLADDNRKETQVPRVLVLAWRR